MNYMVDLRLAVVGLLCLLLANVAWSVPLQSIELEPNGPGYEEPGYNLTDDQPADGSYEVRRYYAQFFAYTSIEAYNAAEANFIGFKRLYNYINGANQGGVELYRVGPVSTTYRANTCVFCKSRFTVKVYLPAAYLRTHYTFPEPTDPLVKVLDHPEYTAYIRGYRGHPFEERSRPEAKKLYDDMTRNNVTDIVRGTMWVKKYRSNGKFYNYDEVMLVKGPYHG